MKKIPKPEIEQLIRALVSQVILGSTHLPILNGLNDADPVVPLSELAQSHMTKLDAQYKPPASFWVSCLKLGHHLASFLH